MSFFTGLFSNRAKLGVALVTLLLFFYLVVSGQRGWLLLTSDEIPAKLMGLAYLVLPVVGAWALIRELMFGNRTEQMARILAEEGRLPVDDLPRTPAGRIVREAADAQFPQYKAETEAAPEDWRSWFRLSCAYDAAGDRTRARRTMRQAGRLYAGTRNQPGA
ncbi:hypothetical protein NNX28_15750 [Arthrobacter sp. zg-Y859]|uniref:Tetratricopeptide repeat-containing protein n=1 Tax=Arthrobacter jinronghuae TaxID=2964609 RepID=A0ABT1NXE9_9MICC|nr:MULTISPECIES: hypothetical protein [Arthrobacter]MCC9175931.1 hypothetical protein [Arthrobacter sp. zg-Y179]MCQ1951374.1 hypothetical protein [Arthrobacter jinronghuae]UWX79771.1 hypothetical protein N2K98_06130 [Arthrobacter jinronghuae]